MNYKLLKELRKGKKITISQLSKSSGIGRNAISCIENGKCNPTIKTLEAICKALEIELRIII